MLKDQKFLHGIKYVTIFTKDVLNILRIIVSQEFYPSWHRSTILVKNEKILATGEKNRRRQSAHIHSMMAAGKHRGEKAIAGKIILSTGIAKGYLPPFY
ncbi:MAG: hypothetical protein DWQ05_10850 [Calditrichaeota bacterium]|nr:MAG: hypothetical protein DWQ05_10850 [Calditrichota bacterium]